MDPSQDPEGMDRIKQPRKKYEERLGGAEEGSVLLRRDLKLPRAPPRHLHSVPKALRKRGRPSRLDERREAVLKMLEGDRRLTRQAIMSKLRIKREATFYEIADGPLEPSGQIFLDHDKVRDLWYLSSGRGRKRTMSQCKEFDLLIDAIKEERLDFYIPRREWRDSLLRRAVYDPLAEKALGIESPESIFEGQEEPKMIDKEVIKHLEKKYSDTTTISGVQIRRTVLPVLREDRDRERGAIYWHIEPVDKKPDGRKLSRKEREEIREVDQPRIKLLLDKCGPMSPSEFMYLIPEAFLASRSKLDPRYFTDERSLAGVSGDELDTVRKAAFGQSKRISIVHTFDVDRVFEWFKRHKSDESFQDEFRRLFEEIREELKAGDKLSEMLARQDQERAKSSNRLATQLDAEKPKG
jgi:hypothetical protein